MPTDPTLFDTTDRTIVIILLIAGLPIKDRRKQGNKTVFVFEREAVKPFLEKYQSGQPIPVDDIRDVFKAESTFNSVVHNDI